MAYVPPMNASWAELQLPWESTNAEDQRFKKLLKQALIPFLAFAIVIPFVPTPEVQREEKEALPPQLAQIVLDEKKLPPPPPVVKKAKPKPKEKVKKAEEKPKPKPKVEPKQVEKVQKAREKAAVSGLLQFQDDLADMRNDISLDKVSNAHLTRANANAAQLDRSVITQKSASKSGGINTAALSTDTGGVALSGRETTKVDSPILAAGQGTKKSRTDQPSGRSDESIRKIMDRNKGAIFAIYNRALRKDPTLQGKVVVQMVIEPSGQVSAVKVVSSELDDSTLESKLLSRIKMIIFGTEDVVKTTLNYSFDFLPY